MKDRITSHWNGRAEEYNKNVRGVIYSKSEEAAWQKILTHSLGENELKVLDVGTGPGILANLLADLGHRVTGVDASEKMLQKATENSSALGHTVHFVQGDAERLPFEEGSFDAVVNRYVLWTLPDPKMALMEWKRVLKPGGRVVIIDGNWYDRRNKSLGRRLWQKLSTFLIVLTERRIPGYHDLDRDLVEGLWSTNARRPQADVEMMMSLGFGDICVLEGINRKILTTVNYLKNGHSGKRFMVSGIK
jgi:ubiquinone/menaquinone biosynthesis C-methylase UbiE